MSYYENRIKELERRIEQMARANRLKAIPVEAQLIDRIAELKKENARLQAEVERLTAELSNISGWGRGLESDLSHARVEISFLKADLERLRKAGDRMAAALNGEYNHELPCVEDWNDAKEGKPSA